MDGDAGVLMGVGHSSFGRDESFDGLAFLVPVGENLCGWSWVLGEGVEVPVDHGEHVGFTQAPMLICEGSDSRVEGFDGVRCAFTDRVGP